MYLVFFLLFAAALGAWGWQLYGRPSGIVHRIHHMMYWLLVLKSLSLFFESVRYHYIALYGVSKMWSEVYYVFAFLKGIMLFTVILLIGSGWSLMKSYLSDQEKRIVWVVLSLQVLDNIAMIVLEETAPGSQGWLTWRDILHLVDIICCCAILLPIVWSIRHLRMAAEVDGKAHNSLLKLQLFRQFYVMVVVYIYFTRIVVFLLAATVPFYLLWLGPFSTEVATLLFFVVTGYKFRPAEDNPYLPVRSEGLEGEEYGLEEDGLGGDFEMTPATTRSSK
ncbi:transmembrane receptor [Ochromonadaceae sp. CCMP2298]|nr:transmembrane receptor [Ochromonadaceae sp. CCMP2298]